METRCEPSRPSFQAKLSVVKEGLSVAKEGLSVVKEGLSVMKEGLSVAKEELSVMKEGLSVAKEELSVMKEGLSVMKEGLSVGKAELSVVKVELSVVKKGRYCTSQLCVGELVLTAGQLVPHVLEAGEKATVHLLQGRHLALPARQPSLNSQQRRSMLITSLLPRPLLLAPLQTSSSSDVSQQTLPSSLQHQSTGVLVHSL